MTANVESALRRKRVYRACDSCRDLKTKCDGRQPICGRCEGYGYTCRWDGSSRKRRTAESAQSRPNMGVDGDEIQKLKQAIRKYDSLLREVRAGLSEADRKALDLGISTIQVSVASPEAIDFEAGSLPFSTRGIGEKDRSSLLSRRYLGEASDITFFHAMKKVLSVGSNVERSGRDSPANQMESYEQEGPLDAVGIDDEALLLPQRELSDRFLETYFSTIHTAYPFIGVTAFYAKYEAFWHSDTLDGFRGPWLSTLLTIFAIGAYYKTFAESTDTASKLYRHQLWFGEAVKIAQSYENDQSIDHISALLVQCFYLLATCQTDRCWTTLGKAIRCSQSIGLHTENIHRPISNDAERVVATETRRRVWYSLYVLDQLLSLQLGRPPAIHAGGFRVTYPSTVSEISITNESSASETDLVPEQHGFSMHYFLAMIRFSGIIARVFSLLYGPKKIDNAGLALSTIQDLDQELMQWKSHLPRYLRFDLAHTFEKCIALKRQRNMLAIKFYNLRALIHRPLLSPAQFMESCPDPMAFYQLEKTRIVQSKKKCVLAAQQTARLLHEIEDKAQLIYGFPWWQMISCLICASSILLVASLCIGREGHDVDDIDWLAVEEDASICLVVFRELSTNSNAARLAEKMMQGLKETRARQEAQSLLQPQPSETHPLPVDNTRDPQSTSMTYSSEWFPFATEPNPLDPLFPEIPLNLSEPVIWSSQFVDSAYNPFFGQSTTDLG